MERPEATAKSPLVNDELIDLRWHQRRRLLLVPDWLVEENFRAGFMEYRPPKLSTEPSDRPLTEHALRLEAERIEKDGADAVLEQFAENTRQRELYGFLNANWHLSNEGLEHPLQRIQEEAFDASKNPPPPEIANDLLGYLLFVIWADWIAGDYLDPRVEQSAKG